MALHQKSSTVTTISDYSKSSRLAMVVCGTILAFLTSGILFGHAALIPVYIQEGVYQHLCLEELSIEGCEKQRQQLNLLFTVGSSINNIACLLFGMLLDRFGPRRTGVLGSFLFASGCLFFFFSTPELELYLYGYIFLGLGGPSLFLSIMHLSCTFPKYSGLVMSAFGGAFDSSSIIFYFFRLIYDASSGTITLKTMFGVYACVGIFSFFLYSFIFPKYTFVAEGDKYVSLVDDLEDTILSTDITAQHHPTEYGTLNGSFPSSAPSSSSSPTSPLINSQPQRSKKLANIVNMTASQQMKTPLYTLATCFMCVMMLRMNYFIGTVKDQLFQLFPDESQRSSIESLANTFDILLPGGGLLAVPIVGWLLDHTSHSNIFFSVITCCAIFGITSMIPSSASIYVCIVVFVVLRPFLYASANSFASRIFGFRNFGKVYGTLNLISGSFCLLQYPLSYLSLSVFNGDFFPVNMTLLVATLLIYSLPIYLKRYGD